MGEQRLKQQVEELAQYKNVKYFTEFEGKENFSNRLNFIFETFLSSDCDVLVVIPNDVYRIDFESIEKLSRYNDKAFNLLNDGRGDQFGGVRNNQNTVDGNVYCGWLEPAFVVNKQTLEKVKPLKPNRPRSSGSGIPHVLSSAFRDAGIELYTPIGNRGYCFHGTHDSLLNPIERKRHPLITISTKQNIVVGIATTKDRTELLETTLASLENQTVQPDKIFVYENEGDGLGLTDNAKFYFTDKAKEYYLTCDDGMIYPPDYIANMVCEIEKNGGKPTTYHGRKLKGFGLNYYQGHESFGCMRGQQNDEFVNVCGTGVLGFNINYMKSIGFDFNSILNDERKLMSDLLFSLEWAKRSKGELMKCVKHSGGWIKEIHYENSIFVNNARDQFKTPVQNLLADEILKIVIDSNSDMSLT